MRELVRVALRAVGVVLPGAAVLGLVALRGGPPDGDFGTFLGAMALSMVAATIWAAVDIRRARPARVVSRWVAAAVVVGVGLGLTSTLTAPGTPPGPERAGEAITLALFYGIPLLAAASLGTVFGAAPKRT